MPAAYKQHSGEYTPVSNNIKIKLRDFFFAWNEHKQRRHVLGIIVILSLQFFTPYFYYIPKSSLAAVIIAAVVFMVEFHVVKPMWKTKSKYTVLLFFSLSLLISLI